MLPEVAIISSKFEKPHELPKRIVLKRLEKIQSYVLITGDGRGPDGRFADAETVADDQFTASTAATFNAQGDVTVLVSPDGDRYTVTGRMFSKTFIALDADNAR